MDTRNYRHWADKERTMDSNTGLTSVARKPAGLSTVCGPMKKGDHGDSWSPSMDTNPAANSLCTNVPRINQWVVFSAFAQNRQR